MFLLGVIFSASVCNVVRMQKTHLAQYVLINSWNIINYKSCVESKNHIWSIIWPSMSAKKNYKISKQEENIATESNSISEMFHWILLDTPLFVSPTKIIIKEKAQQIDKAKKMKGWRRDGKGWFAGTPPLTATSLFVN